MPTFIWTVNPIPEIIICLYLKLWLQNYLSFNLMLFIKNLENKTIYNICPMREIVAG